MPIDLRSDTVTLPTPAMREAMARAEVGDDVYREDPTVNRLEALAAARMGKAAGLFVPSGTMANLVSLLTHCGRGDEVIIGDKQHSVVYEAGGMAAAGSIMPRTVPNRLDGTMPPDEIEAAVRSDNVHFPRTRLIVLENTHNRCYGSPLPPEYVHAVRAIADRHGLKIHTDGARIFNAAVALGVPAAALVQESDTVSFCLSKGLSAPVGSVVCGPAAFIAEARRTRKMLGGGMRQAGMLAAAGIVALETMVDRLAEDHANARFFAESVAGLAGVHVEPERVKTNIVFFEATGHSAATMSERLRARGVLINPADTRQLRAVMHYGISRADVETAREAIWTALSEGTGAPARTAMH